MPVKRPHPVDIELGRRLEAARRKAGLSLQGLAPGAGITWQQVRKYKLATNRVTVSRLVAIARALGKPATEFVDGLERIQEARRGPRGGPSLLRRSGRSGCGGRAGKARINRRSR